MEKFYFHSIQSTTYSPKINSFSKKNTIENSASTSFATTLQQVMTDNEKLIVSKHAKTRMQDRQIVINDSQWNAISEKVTESKQKGVKEALVLLKDAALIISAKNNTVITAMNREEAKSQIFTNINGTILMD